MKRLVMNRTAMAEKQSQNIDWDECERKRFNVNWLVLALCWAAAKQMINLSQKRQKPISEK